MVILPHSLTKSKAAADYTRRGYLVFPLYTIKDGQCSCGDADCPSPGKHPLTTNGFKNATNDARTVEAWWRQWPEANVGLATGRAAGFFVLDVDGPEGAETLKTLEEAQGALPPTATVITGNGKHFYFKYPENGEIKNSTALGPGLHLRGEGGYVVAPPSDHVSGRRYEWLVSPDEVGLAEAPSWLVEFISRRSQSSDGQGRTGIDPLQVLAGVPEGERDNKLFLYACHLRGKGLTREEAEVLVLQAAGNCKPPFPEREALRKVESAWSYADKDKEQAQKEGKITQSQKLVELVGINEVTLFHTPDRDCWGSIEIGGHKEHWPIKSKSFRRYLSQKFFDLEGKPPTSQAMLDALNVIEARAQFEGAEENVYVRIAEHDNAIYLDLCNDDWEVVKVTKKGWQVIKNPRIRFRRTKGALALPYPERGGSIEELRKFVNVADEASWQLVVAFILACLEPNGPYPILLLYGAQGSAKSTTARVIKELVDPSIVSLRGMLKDERELAIAAKNSWILSFDNVSNIPDWLSDAFCRLSIGLGIGPRMLFTDDEEALFHFKRPCILNGITEFGSRHDLIDRALILTLPQIAERKRKQEKDFWMEFEEAKPQILGAFLDAVVVGLQRRDNIELEELPRMADFAHWITACEPALPWADGEFLKNYKENRKEAIDTAIDNDPMSSAIRELIMRDDEWEGTATELLEELEDIAGRGKVGERVIKSKAWPQSPSALGKRLRRAQNFLRSIGIDINFGISSMGIKIIRITKGGNS